MPRRLNNWSFNDIVMFLKHHHFSLCDVRGSHYYYKGLVDNQDRLCHIQRHPDESIPPKTLQHDIISKSGIPEKFWLKWAEAGSKRLKKKIKYEGALDINK